MKKFGKLFLSAACLLTIAGCSSSDDSAKQSENAASSNLDIAMITDYGDITDQSFNQATYEGCKD